MNWHIVKLKYSAFISDRIYSPTEESKEISQWLKDNKTSLPVYMSYQERNIHIFGFINKSDAMLFKLRFAELLI